MLVGKTVALFSAVPWSGIHARPQQFATRLAKMGVQVLFVEPAASLLTPLKQRHVPLFSTVRQLEPNLAVLTPPLLLPGGYGWGAINRANQHLLWRSVNRAARELKWSVNLVLTHLPGTADIPVDLPIIYDCVDDHAAFSELSYLWRRTVVERLEQRLLRRAWKVFASSDKLLSNCQVVRPDAVLVGNGADVLHFAVAAEGYSNTLAYRRPIIGFYGGIGPWVDLELIAQAAKAEPDYTFVMLGPADAALKLPELPNLHFLGLIAYTELPLYLADFDVALVPFKNTEVTQSVNPIKLYEYFAAGKPVIVADIPELRRWEPLVYVASTALELVAAVERALQEPLHVKAARQQAAKENSWDTKLSTILQVAGNLP